MKKLTKLKLKRNPLNVLSAVLSALCSKYMNEKNLFGAFIVLVMVPLCLFSLASTVILGLPLIVDGYDDFKKVFNKNSVLESSENVEKEKSKCSPKSIGYEDSEYHCEANLDDAINLRKDATNLRKPNDSTSTTYVVEVGSNTVKKFFGNYSPYDIASNEFDAWYPVKDVKLSDIQRRYEATSMRRSQVEVQQAEQAYLITEFYSELKKDVQGCIDDPDNYRIYSGGPCPVYFGHTSFMNYLYQEHNFYAENIYTRPVYYTENGKTKLDNVHIANNFHVKEEKKGRTLSEKTFFTFGESIGSIYHELALRPNQLETFYTTTLNLYYFQDCDAGVIECNLKDLHRKISKAIVMRDVFKGLKGEHLKQKQMQYGLNNIF